MPSLHWLAFFCVPRIVHNPSVISSYPLYFSAITHTPSFVIQSGLISYSKTIFPPLTHLCCLVHYTQVRVCSFCMKRPWKKTKCSLVICKSCPSPPCSAGQSPMAKLVETDEFCTRKSPLATTETLTSRFKFYRGKKSRLHRPAHLSSYPPFLIVFFMVKGTFFCCLRTKMGKLCYAM